MSQLCGDCGEYIPGGQDYFDGDTVRCWDCHTLQPKPKLDEGDDSEEHF